MLALKFFVGGGSSCDLKELSKGRVAPGAALRVRRRVEDALEGSFTITFLSEWMEDDVDHLKFSFTRADDIIHLDFFFFARVLPLSGLESYVLPVHLLVHVSRVLESEWVPGWGSPSFQSR